MDLTQAAQFLEHLTQGEPVTFQTFDESKRKRSQLSRIMHGTLEKNRDCMEALNQKGAGVFFMVNVGDLKGRKRKNVQRVRAVFVDLDGKPLEPVLEGKLQPHITIESSPGRYHAYWRINDLPLNEFSAAQLMLASRFSSDPAVKDLPRVMRLPGFMHQKHEPYLTKILKINSTGAYQRTDLIDAFGFNPAITSWRDSLAIAEGDRNTTLFSMAQGFVKKGFNLPEIVSRLRKVNESRCAPPLLNDELEEIASRAHYYGTPGTLNLEYRFLDSAYQKLSPGAVKLDIAARRIANGNPDILFSLVASEMEKWGFGNPKTLRRYREELINNGLLTIHRPPTFGRNGEVRECGLYQVQFP